MLLSTFINNLKSGRTLVTTGDTVTIANKKHTAYGMIGTVVCKEPDGIQWLGIEPLNVAGLYETDPKISTKFYDNSDYHVDIIERKTMSDIFGRSTVYVGKCNPSNGEYSDVFKLQDVYDSTGCLVHGVVEVYTNGSCQEPPQIHSFTSPLMMNIIFDIGLNRPTIYYYEQISLDTYSASLNKIIHSKTEKYVDSKSEMELPEPSRYVVMYLDDYSLMVEDEELKPTIQRLISEGVNPSTIHVYEIGKKVDFSFNINVTLPEG